MKLRGGWDASLGDPLKGERGGWTAGSDMERGSAVNLAGGGIAGATKAVGVGESEGDGTAGWGGGWRGFVGELFTYNGA